MRRPILGALVSVAACAPILTGAAPAGAVTLHVHRQVALHPVVGHDPAGPVRGTEIRTVERVVRIAPADSDQDGYSDEVDACDDDPYAGNGGCTPAPPDPEPAAATSYDSSSYASSGACPASLAGESTSPTARNPSGASGCIQAMPETWAAYGDPAYASAADAPVDVQMEAMARICAAQGNDAWVAADPC